MAKKKKSKKKVHRRHTASSAASPAGQSAPMASQPVAPVPITATAAPVTTPSQTATPSSRQSYVGRDVRRIGILATGCVVAELILWYLFTYTNVGTSVYSLVK